MLRALPQMGSGLLLQMNGVDLGGGMVLVGVGVWDGASGRRGRAVLALLPGACKIVPMTGGKRAHLTFRQTSAHIFQNLTSTPYDSLLAVHRAINKHCIICYYGVIKGEVRPKIDFRPPHSPWRVQE